MTSPPTPVAGQLNGALPSLAPAPTPPPRNRRLFTAAEIPQPPDDMRRPPSDDEETLFDTCETD